MPRIAMANFDTGNFPIAQKKKSGMFPISYGAVIGEYPGMANLKIKSKANPLLAFDKNGAASLLSPVLKRIDHRIAILRTSRNKVLQEAGLKPDRIRDLEDAKTGPSVDIIIALAPVLQTTPEWLAFGVGEETPGEHAEEAVLRVVIKGEVAAGTWLEIDALQDEPIGELPFAPDPNYPVEAQFALGVRGTSINRVARPGDMLLCLDLAITGIEPVDGDLVIVERRRGQGAEKEVTAKRLYRRRALIDLVPDSDDPRWRDPVTFDTSKPLDDIEIAIVAIVTGVYRQIRSVGRT